jgi:putative chitinase
MRRAVARFSGRISDIRHQPAFSKSSVSGITRRPFVSRSCEAWWPSRRPWPNVYGLGNPSKARELGNTRPGDGYLFRGGGMLQTTGGTKYREIGADFYADPDRIVDRQYALQAALNEWSDELNTAADRNDIRTITRVINGGYIGLPERQHWLDLVWPIASGSVSPPPAWQAALPSDDTRWLQVSLNQLGTQPQLVVDGRGGPATTAAVKWFQGIAGVPIDGIAGEVTCAAIRLRLATT